MSRIDSYYARFDDLNVICQQYNALYFKKPNARKKCLEEIEDFLIVAYKEGIAAVSEMLGLDLAVSLGLMEKALKHEIEGLTYIDRIEEHIDTGDYGLIKTVAETEYHRIFNTAEQDAAEDAVAQRKAAKEDAVRDAKEYAAEQRRIDLEKRKQDVPRVVPTAVSPATGDYGKPFKPMFDSPVIESSIKPTNFDEPIVVTKVEVPKVTEIPSTPKDEEEEEDEIPDTPLTKTWKTKLDNRVRDTHSYLEGVTVAYNDEFITFDGDSAMAPGGFSDVENNANCRCHLEYKWAE